MKRILFCMAVLMALTAFGQDSRSKAIDYVIDHFKISGYAQAGWEYDENNDPNNEFLVARIIMIGDYQINDRWNAFIMADFRKFSLHELWVNYKVAPWMNVKFGQFKTPFSLENPISPVVMEMITQMSLAGNFMVAGGSPLMMPGSAGRDIGLNLFGDLGRYVTYDVAVMNGAGRNQKDNNSWKDVVGRLTFHPLENLDVSGSMILGKGSRKDLNNYLGLAPDPAVNGNYTRNRFAVGAQLKTKPVNLRAEWMWGKDEDLKTNGGYATVQVNNVGVKNLDLVGSVDHIELDESKINRYQAGVQYWFYKQCRLQAAYSYTDVTGGGHSNGVLTQVQVAF